ncbi:MAG TPA: hypothetical protein DCP28_03785, partial [Cytophagales bacterium]|nr:hypothetical protein [Cytophagales bacterium]
PSLLFGLTLGEGGPDGVCGFAVLSPARVETGQCNCPREDGDHKKFVAERWGGRTVGIEDRDRAVTR